MNDLVEVIVNDFSEVYKASFLNLDLALSVKFESRSMNESQVANVILPIYRAYHELIFP